MDTKVLKCTCKHEFQDKQYGPQMRLHNLRDPKAHKNECTCTVCGAKKSF